VAASPLDGAVSVFWSRSLEDGTGQVVQNSNTTLNGGFFGPDPVFSARNGLLEVIASAHDNQGNRHVLYWAWPNDFCDHHAVVNTAGDVLYDEVIPGSCDTNTPRKIGGIATDGAGNVHVLLARNGQTGTMGYWERTAAGWVVQGEGVAVNCCPGDMAITVSSQGVVMVAFKSTAVSGEQTDIYTVTRQGTGNWTAADDISAACCSACPGTSGAYLPHLASDSSGGIRIVWADGRCNAGDPNDIYYREWVPGTGWNGQPIVQVVNNSGGSYFPTIAVDPSGEAHIGWSDDTSSPVNYYRFFYAHGRGTHFSSVEIPLSNWDPSHAWEKESSIDYGGGAIHVAFSSNRYDSAKDSFYMSAPVNIVPTNTPTPSHTPTITPTPTSTSTPTLVPAPCPNERFHDVCPGTYYYTPVLSLNDAGIVNGYNSTPPCLNSLWVPCYNPWSNTTRGHMSKIVILASGLRIDTTGFPHSQDVDATNVFSTFIETAVNNDVVNGYPCGGVGEPCVGPNNLPYFRTNNSVTRGQLVKMGALAFRLSNPPAGQMFQDVAPGSTFYTYTQQTAQYGIIAGYGCGGPGEPCVSPANRPYFRPNSVVTRGQSAKIVEGYRTRTEETATPTLTATATYTNTPEPTSTTVVEATVTITATSTTEPLTTATSTAEPPTSTSTPIP